MIGVALGSPGESPLAPLPSEGTSWAYQSSSLPQEVPYHSGDPNVVHPKANRWKGLGGLFGKRSGPAQRPPAPLRQRVYVSPHKTREDYHRPLTPQISSAQPVLHKPTVAHNQNNPPRDWIGPAQLPSPRNQESKNVLRKASLTRNYFARKKAKDAEASGTLETDSWRRQDDSPVTQREAQSGSLLQVEIPNIELERYSVMFSSLLQPAQQPIRNRQPSPKRRPSLLARRQANLPELHAPPPSDSKRPWIDEELSLGHRTVSPTNSPSFSLFPPSPAAHGRRTQNRGREQSPLHRSATSPAALSPSKAKFDFFQTAEQQDQVILIVHTPSEPSESRRQSRNEDLIYHPTWQDTTSSDNKRTLPKGKDSGVLGRDPSPSPLNGRNNSPQGPPDTRKPSDDPGRKAAEVSIARQISISRQQSQLLVPRVPKVAPQPVQPKIIDVQQGGMARKSHHLVLEDV
ncbi:MAG: hypothetical protein Q9201_001724 [Fulgogasparrea decipioides]